MGVCDQRNLGYLDCGLIVLAAGCLAVTLDSPPPRLRDGLLHIQRLYPSIYYVRFPLCHFDISHQISWSDELAYTCGFHTPPLPKYYASIVC